MLGDPDPHDKRASSKRAVRDLVGAVHSPTRPVTVLMLLRSLAPDRVS